MNRHERRRTAAISSGQVPWSTLDYVHLEPLDLEPKPDPTPQQRVRVAAVLATMMRDHAMCGGAYGAPGQPNAEMIRALLICNPEAWARDIGEVRKCVEGRGFDVCDPKVRFEQTRAAWERGRS